MPKVRQLFLSDVTLIFVQLEPGLLNCVQRLLESSIMLVDRFPMDQDVIHNDMSAFVAFQKLGHIPLEYLWCIICHSAYGLTFTY